jgi:hypothetical protein
LGRVVGGIGNFGHRRPPLPDHRYQPLPPRPVVVLRHGPLQDGHHLGDGGGDRWLHHRRGRGSLHFHTVRYAGVLASASKLRPLIVPQPPPSATDAVEAGTPKGGARCGWRPWAELMQRVFMVDVEKCPLCGAAMKLRAIVTEPANIRRYLRYVDEATELPHRAPARDPPYFRSSAVRRKLSQQLQLIA